MCEAVVISVICYEHCSHLFSPFVLYLQFIPRTHNFQTRPESLDGWVTFHDQFQPDLGSPHWESHSQSKQKCLFYYSGRRELRSPIYRGQRERESIVLKVQVLHMTDSSSIPEHHQVIWLSTEIRVYPTPWNIDYPCDPTSPHQEDFYLPLHSPGESDKGDKA